MCIFFCHFICLIHCSSFCWFHWPFFNRIMWILFFRFPFICLLGVLLFLMLCCRNFVMKQLKLFDRNSGYLMMIFLFGRLASSKSCSDLCFLWGDTDLGKNYIFLWWIFFFCGLKLWISLWAHILVTWYYTKTNDSIFIPIPIQYLPLEQNLNKYKLKRHTSEKKDHKWDDFCQSHFLSVTFKLIVFPFFLVYHN